ADPSSSAPRSCWPCPPCCTPFSCPPATGRCALRGPRWKISAAARLIHEQNPQVRRFLDPDGRPVPGGSGFLPPARGGREEPADPLSMVGPSLGIGGRRHSHLGHFPPQAGAYGPGTGPREPFRTANG